MSMEVKIVGEIKFKTCTLPVYRDLDEPLFKAGDVAELMDYGPNNIWNLTNLCEEDERLVLSSEVAGQHRRVTFLTESGLYNVLAQGRKPGCQGVAAGHCRGVDCRGGPVAKISRSSSRTGTTWRTPSTLTR